MKRLLRKLSYLGIAVLVLVPAKSAFCSYATLTVTIDPPGGGSVMGEGIDCPTNCSETYWVEFSSKRVDLTAIPSQCYDFSHWSGDLTGSVNPRSITFNTDKSVTAHFVPKTGTLSLSDPMATPDQIYADGTTRTMLTVKVNYQGSPPSVSVDLSSLGRSSSQAMYDDGTNGDAVAGDGIYSVQTTVKPSTPIAMKALQVTATDGCNRVIAAIKLFVTSLITGMAQPGSVDTNSVSNTITGQVLKVNHKLSQPAGLHALENGETTLAVRNPAGQIVATETMSPTTSTITIENAAAGNYTYEVENEGTAPQAYQIETVTGGLGIIIGTVTDAIAGTNLTGIRLSTDTGGASITLEGNYVMVAVAGVFTVTAVSLGYDREDIGNVTLSSGGTVTVDLALTPVMIPFNVNGVRTNLIAPPRVGATVQITILLTRSQSNPHYRWLWNTIPFAAWQTLADWAIFNDSEPWSPPSENRFVVLAHAAEVGETTDFHQGGLLFETDGNSASPIQIREFTTDIDYPQHTGTPITLNATAGGGSGQLYFKFFYRLNLGGWMSVGDWTEDGQDTWTPQQAGFYTIVVHISEDNTVVNNPLSQAGMTFAIEE